METLVMIVSKAGYNNRGQLFVPCVANRALCKPTTQPLLDGCRALVANGFDPRVRVVMRCEGSDVDALISTVGHSAGLTVKEQSDGKREIDFGRWIPFPSGMGTQNIDADDLEAAE